MIYHSSEWHSMTEHLNSLLAFWSKGEVGLGTYSVKATEACMFGFSLGEMRGFTSNGCDLLYKCVGEHVFPHGTE